MKNHYDIKPSERLTGLGISNVEVRLNYFLEKSKWVEKLKRFSLRLNYFFERTKPVDNLKNCVQKNIINTQRKDWN